MEGEIHKELDCACFGHQNIEYYTSKQPEIKLDGSKLWAVRGPEDVTVKQRQALLLVYHQGRGRGAMSRCQGVQRMRVYRD